MFIGMIVGGYWWEGGTWWERGDKFNTSNWLIL